MVSEKTHYPRMFIINMDAILYIYYMCRVCECVCIEEACKFLIIMKNFLRRNETYVGGPNCSCVDQARSRLLFVELMIVGFFVLKLSCN